MANITVMKMQLDSFSSNIDQLFLVSMGMFVFFMQCGFAFLEAGAVRSKNTTNILIKNVLSSFVSGIAYWTFGYAFAYGDGKSANSFIGATNFASHELPENKYAMFFFQYTLAATSATIVSGAVAERCEFGAYIVYSFFVSGFIYPTVSHWVWGGGWLSQGMEYSNYGVVAYQDFAGSGTVHMLGGVAALSGAVIIGPRYGRFNKATDTYKVIRGHSVPILCLGGFILFFGFLAFNGGSQLSISRHGDGEAVSLSVVNTIIAASFAAFGSLIINRIKVFRNKWSILTTINGALTGMVATCAGCNQMYPWGACVVGVCASISYTVWSAIMKKLRIDDPTDAIAVHFGGGLWGVIAVALLDKNEGIVMEWSERSGYKLAWQVCGLAAISTWTAFLSFLLFGVMNAFGALRVSLETEELGLDIPKHREMAYPELLRRVAIDNTTPSEHHHPAGASETMEQEDEEDEMDIGLHDDPEIRMVRRNYPDQYQEQYIPHKRDWNRSRPIYLHNPEVTRPQWTDIPYMYM